MARRDKGKKAMSLAEMKELANSEERAIRRQTEEFNSWLTRMEDMGDQELKEYVEQNKDAFSSQKKAAMKKLLQKEKPKKKKKRATMSPIMGAVWKFHKDDDVDSAGVAA